MPALANIFEKLKREREPILAARTHLLSNAVAFEADLQRIIRPWTLQNDPLTDRPWIKVEAVTGVRWGKRLLFYNGHFVEFIINEMGEVVVRPSAGEPVVYDRGCSPPAGRKSNFSLDRTNGDGDIITIPLETVITDYTERLIYRTDGKEVRGS